MSPSPRSGRSDRVASRRLRSSRRRWMAGRRPSGQRGCLMIDAEATERFMAAPWLADVDPDAKKAIFEALVEARAPAGATLLEQDQPNDHLSLPDRRQGRDPADVRGPPARGDHHDRGPVRIRHHLVLPARSALGRGPGDVRRMDALALSSRPRGTSAEGPAGGRGPGRRDPPLQLSERFDLMDHLLSDYISRHGGESSRTSEWAGFRARLFDERGL